MVSHQRKRESPTGSSTRCVRMFGILGKDGHHVRAAEATNSRTFLDFLKWVRLKYPKLVPVWTTPRTTSRERSWTIRRTSTWTSVWYSCPRTRRSSTHGTDSFGKKCRKWYQKQGSRSPTGILWWEIKRQLSCRYFEPEEDLERAITETVGGGELKAVKTMDYLAARDTVCGRLSGCFLGIPAPQYDAGLQFLNCCRLIVTRNKSSRRRTSLATPDSCRILMPRCRIFMAPTMRKRWTSACRS